MEAVTVQNWGRSFWTVAFLAYDSACLEFTRTVTSEAIVKKEATVQFS